MSSVIYAIVFKGEIIDGFQPISVKAHMAKLLKADIDKMQTLFSGKQIVIKRTADKAEALKYANALKKIGADIKVRAIKTEAPAADAEATAPTTGADTSGLSLAPNEGFIVEPKPPPPPLELDLSGLSLAENDGTLLAEPKQEDHIELDLSEYSIKENDGSPLVTASTEAPPIIDAPDFGLDEVGATLETIPDEREKLNPNTMGMTLAMAGSELLEPEEKKLAPPPKAPDTSSLSLVANFD